MRAGSDCPAPHAAHVTVVYGMHLVIQMVWMARVIMPKPENGTCAHMRSAGSIPQQPLCAASFAQQFIS